MPRKDAWYRATHPHFEPRALTKARSPRFARGDATEQQSLPSFAFGSVRIKIGTVLASLVAESRIMNRNVCVSTAVLTAVYCVIVQIRLGTNTLDALVGYLGAMLFVGGVVTVMLLAQRSLRNLEEKNLELEQWIERRTADLHAAQEATEAAAREKVQQKKQILAEEEKPIDEAGAKPVDAEGQRSESWTWSKERTVPSKTEAGQIETRSWITTSPLIWADE